MEGGAAMAVATVSTGPDTIVMSHDLWMTPPSWENWKERYEARGNCAGIRLRRSDVRRLR